MRLHRFEHSSYARWVQAAVQLAHVSCEIVDVPYGNRQALAELTGGYVQVPVMELDDGTVLRDSRSILETLVREDARFAPLVPEPDAAPVWAYADWAMTSLEDVAFRLATPKIARRFATAHERGLFVLGEERRFGPGCVDAWEREADALFERLDAILEPTRRTLAMRDYVIGRAPTLADAALYGQLAMLDLGAPDRVAELGGVLHAWRARFEERMGPPPYGRIAARHRDPGEMERLLARAPAHSGALELIVVRTAMHERATPERIELDVAEGVRGDRWRTGGKPDQQVSLVDARVAEAIAARADWPLFGDNLFVGFDISHASLRTGDRLRIGSAVLEITDAPHRGCRKLAARFGPRALRFVNHAEHHAARRRGVFARVVESGTASIGDRVERL